MTRTRAQLINELMERINLAGHSAADLVHELHMAGDNELASSVLGMHRRLRSLCDTTFALYEDEVRRNPQDALGDYHKGTQA